MPMIGVSVDWSNLAGSMACLGRIGIRPRIKRQFAVLGSLDVEADPALSDPLDALHLGIVAAVVGQPLVAQQLEAEDRRRRP